MKALRQYLFSVAAAALLGCLAQGAMAAEYELDPAHSFVQFRISHLGFSTLVGRFNDLSGNFDWDRGNPGASQIDVVIDTASIDTNHAERDKHLRSDDFLDVEKYPQATFKSIKYNGDEQGGTLEGELTLHGVTQPITLDVKTIGEGDDPWGGYRAGFSGTTMLTRKDFGMGYDLGPAAETMEMHLFIEGVRQ